MTIPPLQSGGMALPPFQLPVLTAPVSGGPLPRIGGLQAHEVKGEDGLR